MAYRTFGILFFLFASCFAAEPESFYLTWKDDPSTTMAVMWFTRGGKAPSGLSYQLSSQKNWEEMASTSRPLFRSDIVVHFVELEGLSPDTEYTFRFSKEKEYRFRTLQKQFSRPLKVAIGGDALYRKEIFEEMNETVASKKPDFVILAGDIAYTEGLSKALRTHKWKVERWMEFFRIWQEKMVTSEGRVIPIMPIVGNHDVLQGFDNPNKKAVLFYELFCFPDRCLSYRTMDIGNEVSFYLLDSGHTYPVAGRQTEWLQEQLEKRTNTRYQIPVYHTAAYPSEVSFTHRSSVDIRNLWVPLFEKHGVKISMEQDNHTFKRTFPIRNNMVVKKGGIIYLGDGSWGTSPLKPQRHWYLAKAAQTNCFWLLTISPESCDCKALNIKGEQIDQLTILPN